MFITAIRTNGTTTAGCGFDMFGHVRAGLSKFVRLARSVTRNRAAVVASGQPSTTTLAAGSASPNHAKSDAPKYSQLANVSSPVLAQRYV